LINKPVHREAQRTGRVTLKPPAARLRFRQAAAVLAGFWR